MNEQTKCSRSGKLAVRVLSMCLILAMLLAFLPASLLPEANAATSDVLIYFKNTDNWSSVYAYTWDAKENQLNGTWPGSKISANADGLYVLSAKVDAATIGKYNFIFSNGNGSQTSDLSLSASQITAGGAYWTDANGNVSKYAPPVANNGKVTFVYEGSASTVKLAGTMNSWSAVTMTKSGSTFSYTYELEPGTYEYKFIVDGNWISDPMNPNTIGSDRNSYIVVAGDASTATANTVKIHFQNTLGWSGVCGSAWGITGSASTPLGDWGWPGKALQKDADGNFLMELQPNLVAGQSMGYLFHDYNSSQTVDLKIDYATLSKGNVELWVKPGAANDEGKFTCTTSTSYTPNPKVDGNKVTFTYTGSATSVYVAGTFNNWSATSAKMTKSGSTFTYTTTLADGIYMYKFVINGKDWIADPANGNVAGNDGNSVLFVGNTAVNTDDSKITVLFHVDKSSGFTGWDSWVWTDIEEGKSYPLQTGVLSDKMVTVTVPSATGNVGFILRKTDWSAQDDTYYVDLSSISSGTVHYYVDYAKDSGMQINDKDVITCGTLSYAKMDYEANTFWAKTTMPVENPTFTIVDANGTASGITVKSAAADGFGYTLTLSKKVKLEDLPNIRIKMGSSTCKIEPNGYLFYSSRFNSEYTYSGDDLGATWSKTGTTFKVWAPTAWKMQVVRYKTGRYDGAWIETVDMTRGANGVWSVTVPGDLNGTYYNYIAHFAGYTTEATDPYAKSTGPNADRSMVLDMSTTNPDGWDKDVSPNQGMTYTDAIIYEMHVREFTIDASSGVKAAWRGKFLGLTQEGTNYQGRATGLDHLKELGVTHVQLMPSYDFGWPDEYNGGGYSWGYNPRHFNVPEGSYSTNPEKGEVRVNEFKQMVQTFHSNGMNVVMDVVYNHLDSAGDFCYNKLVPYYFTRFWDQNGDWSQICNGSGVGNDFATQRSMARNYIVDSLSWWVEEYHVDGFRFDLAGLIDTQTMNEAIRIIQAKYPSVIFYGEGWDNYGTNMEGYDTCTQYNAGKVPSFAFFNNTIRDAVGGNESKDNGEWGFAMGSSEKAETVMYSMRGMNSWSNNPNQTINYVSCHDGYSLTDKICVKRGGAYWGEIAAMNRLAGASILLSQGIPMIYGGDEILREKIAPEGWRAHNSGHEGGVDLDALNSIKWSELVTKDSAQTNDDYYAGLIEFRKNHSALRCSYIGSDGTPDAQKYTSAHRISDQCIMIYVDGYPNYECSDGIVIILNSGSSTQWVNFYDYGVPAGDWQACVHGDKAGAEALWTTNTGSVGVEPYSATVLVKGDLIDENSIYNKQGSTTVCRHTSHDEDGKCTSCGIMVNHSFSNGVCTICGKESATTDGETMTIYFQNNWKWDDVKAYYWGTTADPGWPGISMELYGNDGTYDIYKLEVPKNLTGLIINGVKDDGSGERDQTPDITSGWYDGICYYMFWKDGNIAKSDKIENILPMECDHSYTSKVTKAPTCTATGTKTFTCSKCGDSYTENIKATGHSYTAKVTAPTCEDKGYTTYTCSACGDSYTDKEVAALGHSYANGVCGTCGGKDPNYVPVVIPTITLKTPTLLLEDTIKLNIYYSIDQDIPLDKMGMITWKEKPSVVDISTADAVYPGATFNTDNGFYGVNTDGIPAQNLGDVIYFCIYAELADGSIAYGKQVQYSPTTYAYNQLKGGATAEMKALLVAILNYGAAAQTYLEDTDALVNADLTDDMKALIEEYRADMVHSVAMPSAAKQGAMASNGGFGAKKPTIALEGAFSINYYFTPSATVKGNMTFYYWNAEDFAKANVLSTSNATGSMVMTEENGVYGAAIQGIAAKDIDSALYACGVYTDENGNTYSTGILPYSLGFYCGNQAKGEGALADLASAIAVYGYYAAAYFAK